VLGKSEQIMGLKIRTRALKQVRNIVTLATVFALALQPVLTLNLPSVFAAGQNITVTVTPKGFSNEQEEAVELTNTGTKPVDISRLYVTEISSGKPSHFFTVPQGTVLIAGQTYTHHSASTINNNGDTISIYVDESQLVKLASLQTNSQGEVATGNFTLEEVASEPAPVSSAPIIGNTSPVAGETIYKSNGTYTIYAEVSDNDKDIASVSWSLDGPTAISSAINPYFTKKTTSNDGVTEIWSNFYNLSSLTPGSYVLTFTAEDHSGNQSIKTIDNIIVAEKKVNLDSTASLVAINSDNSIRGLHDLRLAIADNEGVEKAYYNILDSNGKTVTIDGAKTFWLNQNSDQTWSWKNGALDTTKLTDGTYTLNVRVTDMAGKSVYIRPHLGPIRVDNSAPVVSNPKLSPLTRDNLTRGDVRVEFTMTDESAINLSQGLTHVRFTNGKGSDRLISSGKYAVQPVEGVADRYYAVVTTKDFVPLGQTIENFRLYVRAQDSLGNRDGYAFFKNQLTIDHTPMTVSSLRINEKLLGQKEQIVTTKNGKLIVSGVAEDDKGLNRIGVQLVKPGVSGQVKYVYANDNKLYGATGEVDWFAEFNVNELGLKDGHYGVNLSYVDKVGNVSTDKVFFVLDTTAPTASLKIDKMIDELEASKQKIVVTGSVANEQHIKSHWFEITDPSGEITYVTNMNTTNNSYSFTLDTSVGVGSYAIRYVATDQAGNRSDGPSYTNSLIERYVVEATSVDPPVEEEDEPTVPVIDGAGAPPASQGSGSVQPQVSGLAGPFTQDSSFSAIVGQLPQMSVGLAGDMRNVPAAANDDSAVLGATNEKPSQKEKVATLNTDNSDILGKNNDKVDKGCGSILGLCWYWWVGILAGVVAVWYGAVRIRRNLREDV
jgi:hypothetical protein